MRIAIITFHNVLNHGGLLQCYALCETLRTLGHTPVVIDYTPPSIRRPYRYRRWHLKHPRLAYDLYRKKRLFRKFQRTHLPLSEKSYRSGKALLNDLPPAESYICGSDQIWNPNITDGFDDAYFLNFPTGGMRKIAYSASFGDITPEQIHGELAKLLQNFDSISVRDERSAATVSKALGKTPELVLDPTLLLPRKRYDTLLAPLDTPNDYIAQYTFGKIKKTEDIAAEISKDLGKPILNVNTACRTPSEWLYCMKHAKCVITNSFHGLCFSLLYAHPCAITQLPESMGGREHRLTYLLNLLNAGKHFVSSREEVRGKKTMQRIFVETATTETIKKLRRNSIDYLKRALSNVITES